MTRRNDVDACVQVGGAGASARLPVDPDLDAGEDARHRPGGGRGESARAGWPRFRAGVLVAVFLGGCLGGYARYAVTSVWVTPRFGFPWSTFAVNVAGAFILAVVVVAASGVREVRYLRPLLGTGFCGALTTFSSVVVAAAQLVAHGYGWTAAAYLALTTVAALLAVSGGLWCARTVAAATGRRERPSC